MTFFRVGVAVPTGAAGPAGGSPVTTSARPLSSRSRKGGHGHGHGPAAFGAAPGSGVPHGVTEGSWGRESFAKPPPGGGTGTGSGSSTSRSGRSDGSTSARGNAADGGGDDGFIPDVDGAGAGVGHGGMDAHEAERLVASLRSQLESTRRLADERAGGHARDRVESKEAGERKAAADAVIMTQLQKQLEVTQEKLTSLTRGAFAVAKQLFRAARCPVTLLSTHALLLLAAFCPWPSMHHICTCRLPAAAAPLRPAGAGGS